MAEGASITLTAAEILELQQILVDADENAALAYLRQTVWHKIKSAQRHLINPKQGTGALD